jgi:hypothetical protein
MKHRIFLLLLIIASLAACKVHRKAKTIAFTDNDVPGKLIVRLTHPAAVEATILRYKKFGLTNSGPLAEHLGIWLFTYDTLKISPQKMAARLLVKGEAYSVEFDKKQPRPWDE